MGVFGESIEIFALAPIGTFEGQRGIFEVSMGASCRHLVELWRAKRELSGLASLGHFKTRIIQRHLS
jgi:hypothetical protein